MRRIVSILLSIALLLGVSPAFAIDDGAPSAAVYTYNYDYWEDVRESPDAYRVATIITSDNLGLDQEIWQPQSLYVRDNDLYIVDSGNNRILQVRRSEGRYSLVRIIDRLNIPADAIREDGTPEPAMLKAPSDVFVDAEGNLYIADTQNHRVIKVDKELNFLLSFTKPEDTTFDQSLDFLPAKIVVDVSGRVFCIATNINKGIIKFENDGQFTGFIGANKAMYSVWDYIWKNYLSTEAQREQMEDIVPTEYANIAMDGTDFIYATNVSFEDWKLRYGEAQPIRRLNMTGADILIKNGNHYPIGDLDWLDVDKSKGPSKFKDITVLSNNVYIALDNTRGRLFGYDSQGINLWCFGSIGNTNGTFTNAVSIEHMGYDLFVLDQNTGTVTVFTPTEYGALIYEACEVHQAGRYEESAALWREVLTINANYDLAFVGIARAEMQKGNYQEAMKYFEMAHDRENYGKAFQLYRKEWVEANIGWMVALAASALVIMLTLNMYKRMKEEVKEYARNRVKN